MIAGRLDVPSCYKPQRGAGRGDLPFTSDQRRRRMRHVVEEALGRAQRRKIRGDSWSNDLEDAIRVEQILERMRPQIAQRDAWRQAVASQVAGGPRDDDLLAVRRP
jgi:hypothetical protein